MITTTNLETDNSKSLEGVISPAIILDATPSASTGASPYSEPATVAASMDAEIVDSVREISPETSYAYASKFGPKLEAGLSPTIGATVDGLPKDASGESVVETAVDQNASATGASNVTALGHGVSDSLEAGSPWARPKADETEEAETKTSKDAAVPAKSLGKDPEGSDRSSLAPATEDMEWKKEEEEEETLKEQIVATPDASHSSPPSIMGITGTCLAKIDPELALPSPQPASQPPAWVDSPPMTADGDEEHGMEM
jgi:hypothetical protein